MVGFRELDVYEKAYRLACDVHAMTKAFPDSERYELGSQIRRAAVSVALNIVEGYGRQDSAREFQHFLRNAMGSCNEVRVILELCKDLGYVDEIKYCRMEETYLFLSKQIFRLRQFRKSRPINTTK